MEGLSSSSPAPIVVAVTRSGRQVKMPVKYEPVEIPKDDFDDSDYDESEEGDDDSTVTDGSQDSEESDVEWTPALEKTSVSGEEGEESEEEEEDILEYQSHDDEEDQSDSESEDEDEEECGDEEEIMDDKEGDGEEVREWKIMGDDGSDTGDKAEQQNAQTKTGEIAIIKTQENQGDEKDSKRQKI